MYCETHEAIQLDTYTVYLHVTFPHGSANIQTGHRIAVQRCPLRPRQLLFAHSVPSNQEHEGFHSVIVTVMNNY